MILSLTACGNRQTQQEETGVSHQTMVTSRSDIALEQSYPASVEGRQSIRIIPRVEGYLADIRIREGQRVSKGQVLFVLDQATYRADERAAQANVFLWHKKSSRLIVGRLDFISMVIMVT